MTTFFGCIADDFTGATDIAGLLMRSGVRVSLRIGTPSSAPDATAQIEVIALKSRTAATEVAVSDARDALDWLRSAGAQRFFWKYCSTFDSTPQGNIGPVAEALMRDLQVKQTVYCPAFPENRRTVYMGNLFVGVQPLSESPMKDHPLTPMLDSNLVRLLALQVSGTVGLADRKTVARGANPLKELLSALVEKGIAHVVVDAITEKDLEVIANAVCDFRLVTGGSAVAMPLPHIWMRQAFLSKDVQTAASLPPAGRAIILSGSSSEMTRRQVAAFLKKGPAFCLDPLELAEQGVDSALNWLKEQSAKSTPIIYATAEPTSVRNAQEMLGREKAGELIEAALSNCAIVAREMGTRRFVIAGGETSGAVTRSLGVERLEIGSEIAPGVPWCFARSAGHEIALALKSGHFGDDSFFIDALAGLERT